MSAPDWLVVITGATAVGKTEISIGVAKALDGEIVSCDSMQVYKYMDIGTAKAGSEEQRMVPHHLIDVVTPDEDFNVARFQELAETAISDIASRGTPILVGGTGLYIKAVMDSCFPGKVHHLRSEGLLNWRLKRKEMKHSMPDLNR